MTKRLRNMKESKFKRYMGVTKETFKYFLKLINQHYKKTKKIRGRKPKLSKSKKLSLTLDYWREYNTQFELGEKYDVSEPTACRTICDTENILCKAGVAKLPGKKILLNNKEKNIIIDVTECSIERPKRKKKGEIEKPSKTILFWKKEKTYNQSSSNCRRK